MKVPVVALSIAAALAACGRSSDTASQDDFKRDLQLASSTNLDLAGGKVDPSLLNSLETKPSGAPEAASTVRKGAGNRAVASHSPTVRATPETDEAAVEESGPSSIESEAPAAESNEPVAVAPRPAPVAIPAAGGGDYGSAGGGVFGGGRGVIIRGGGVDGDHCQIHSGRGRTGGAPVFIPMPTVPRAGPVGIAGRIFTPPSGVRGTSGRGMRGSR